MTSAAAPEPHGAGRHRRPRPADAHVIHLIEADYREMPGLTLTGRQAARLWALDPAQVERVLNELIRREFLTRDGRGAYRRRNCPRC